MAINLWALRHIRRTLLITVVPCLILNSLPAHSEQVETKLQNGVIATANFHGGLSSLPAVIILHGFLQTYHSPPMSSLASNLSSRGYTVLSPTMSLNVNRRSQSMACESVHAHSMENEVDEVSYWVSWLNTKGYKEIALVGFSSTGNIAALLLSAKKTQPSIKHIILTSLNPVYLETAERQKLRTKMSTSLSKTGKQLERVSLGYCRKNYITTAGNYLTYAQYDSYKILELIRDNPVPAEIILGTTDTILPDNWAEKISGINTQNNVTLIKNATHFFEDTNEFDLAEAVENTLKKYFH